MKIVGYYLLTAANHLFSVAGNFSWRWRIAVTAHHHNKGLLPLCPPPLCFPPCPLYGSLGLWPQRTWRYKPAVFPWECFVSHGSVALETYKKNKVKDHGLTSHGSIGSTDTHCCFKIHLKLCPADYSTGEAGVWLSGLPVGSHHDQLFSHHHGHPRPVWCSPVQITLRYNGKSNTECCLIRNSCFWFVIKKVRSSFPSRRSVLWIHSSLVVSVAQYNDC